MSKPGEKPVVLGFMTVRATAKEGLRGGYLLTTDFGRPIEFHYTSELRVTRQERVLYGAGFEASVYAESLGKPMTDRQGTAPRIILVDHPALLELRRLIPAPVVLLKRAAGADETTTPPPVDTECHSQFSQDRQAFEKLCSLVPASFDWLEPFERLEQALAEVRDAISLAAA